MIGGSALKFHLNNVAAQGKLGIPPIFGLTNNNNGQQMPQQSNYSSANNQINPQMMEQMRQQATPKEETIEPEVEVEENKGAKIITF